MFKNVKAFCDGEEDLAVDQDSALTNRDIQVATIALLSEIAHADKGFDSSELTSVIGAMFLVFGTSDTEGAELLEIAEFLRKERGKVDKFVETLNKHLDLEQKQKVLSILWKVIKADGKADKYETAAAVILRKKLNLTLEQAVRAQVLSSEY